MTVETTVEKSEPPKVKRRFANIGYSIRGAARELGLDQRQLGKMIKYGQVRVVPLGAGTLVPRSEVARLKQELA